MIKMYFVLTAAVCTMILRKKMIFSSVVSAIDFVIDNSYFILFYPATDFIQKDKRPMDKQRDGSF